MEDTSPPLSPSLQPTHPSLLSTHRGLIETIASFLTVATHHIIFLRRIYPPISFLSVRAYNYAVRQNRHPAVCAWINDAISAVQDQLERNTVEKVSLCIYECRSNRVLEKWTFDLHSLPSISRIDRDIPFDAAEPPPETAEDQLLLTHALNVADLEANFRATLSRISTAAGRLGPLPDGPNAPGCSFTLAIEVKDDADRPVGTVEPEERRWMAADPPPPHPLTPTTTDNTAIPAPESASQAQTHSVRRVETGELRMEVWVEESAAKFDYSLPPQPGAAAERRAAKMSYGAGKDKFNPQAAGHASEYDLEAPDVNRKPQGGAMTDYQRDR
ncbi:hypothetical protein PV08_08895 [Exophiala spinifera]|uniref:HORMA domain-containing protein n=1 Tax=Exophiala spinifera TaxID=91928 RepID=A0A0D2BR50_9EURO|nr:uncharacterized protein PV08_08895 [Exophiala spinifera]KIW13704.1 hypothetical protein PV08_08895 [Exophiala spinifera]